MGRAFRDDVIDCIELTQRHKGRRARYTVMGWAAVLRVYLRHPLDAPVFDRRALILRMSATHSQHPSSLQPRPHLFTSPPGSGEHNETASPASPSSSGILEKTCWFGAEAAGRALAGV